MSDRTLIPPPALSVPNGLPTESPTVDEDVVTSLRLQPSALARAERIADHLAETPTIYALSNGRPSRSAVLRLALVLGLDALDPVVDCTVMHCSVALSGGGFRSMVRYFLHLDTEHRPPEWVARGVPGVNARDEVLVGWSIPLGQRTYLTREDLERAVETEPTSAVGHGSVPDHVWLETFDVFESREPHDLMFPQGVGIRRDFARRHGLQVSVPTLHPHVSAVAPA